MTTNDHSRPNHKLRFQTLEALRCRLEHLRGIPLTWAEIAAMREFGGASAGLLSSVLNGYEPKTNLTRAKLNLPPLTAEAPYCPVHDTVHCFDCQTEQVKPKPKPAKRKPRIRIAADVTEEQRERLHEIAGGLGMSWSEFCQALADREFWPIEPRWS